MSNKLVKTRNKNVYIPFLLALVLVIGLVSGYYLSGLIGNKRDLSTILSPERSDKLEEIIDLVEENYVDTILIDSLYQDAVAGILRHLDPHTTYIPAKEFTKINETLEGNFKGIGIEFQFIADTAMVSFINAAGPSEKRNIKTGDKIIKVNDTLIAGVNLGKAKLVEMVRNPAFESVKLEIYRPTERKQFSLTIPKHEVPISSIDGAYMIDHNTGYIRIKRFSGNTYNQFIASLEQLKQEGMVKLILDLRQNPGGYLDAATDIADELISGNKLLVYTKGNKVGREDYYANRTGKFETGRLVILVDEGSASASEILAGAVQDWDRGLIVGRTTFGKGLVQEQFELGDGAALRLTIARYYTPVGRCIQRSYEEGREEYEEDYIKRVNEGSQLSETEKKKLPHFFTQERKRVVYGGGGIMPDVPFYTKEYYSKELTELLSNPVLDEFIYDLYARQLDVINTMKSFSEFNLQFEITPAIEQELKLVASIDNPNIARAIWNNPRELQFIKSYVKATIARIKFNNSGYYQVINKEDKMLSKALALINSDEYSQYINGEIK